MTEYHGPFVRTQQISIAGLWAEGITGGAIKVGNYSTPIAFGEVTDNLIGSCVHISGYTDGSQSVIPIHGKVTTTGDSGTGGTAQSIYGRVDIKHDLPSSYAVRGAITIDGAVGSEIPEVNQVYGMFATMGLTACNLASTGQVAGLAVELTGSEDITGTGSPFYGKVSGIRIAWEHTHAMSVDTCGIYTSVKSGATLDSGYRVDAAGALTNSFHSYNSGATPTNVLKIEGAHTNVLSLPAAGTAPVSAGGVIGTHGAATLGIAILINDATYYLLASTTPTFTT